MIGNRPGWLIALLIAVGFGVLLRELAAVNRLTPPTATAALGLAPLAVEVPPDRVMAFDALGDARPLYRQAVDAVLRDPSGYARLEAAGDARSIDATPAAAALLAAARRAGDPLGDPVPRATYAPPPEDAAALTAAARCVGRAARLNAAADPAKARALYEAQFALGAKLFAGRVRLTEALDGLSLARDAAAGLRDLAAAAGDTRRAALLATFDRSAAGLEAGRLVPVGSATAALDGQAVARHAGDVYRLAGPATGERVWRVEAILALGRHRYAAARDADRLAVPRRLAELRAGETDPAVLAAIDAAERLTVEEFRMIR